MSLSSWLSSTFSRGHAGRAKRRNSVSRPKTARLFLEQLESRVTPSFGLSTLGSFNGANGAIPQAGLIMDGSGNLYGTTYSGGASGAGTVFEVAKGSNTITVLASFDGTTAANPQAGLVMDSSGNLYGTTVNEGASGDGTVFELAKVGSTYSSTITTLVSFTGSNGETPAGQLFMDSGGNLYGTTEFGGASDDGIIFELAKGSSTITALASFDGADGAYPAGVMMNSSGNLYGTATDGGASGDGTVFELAKGKSTITTLASFTGSNGDSPQAGLVMDSSGNLYGTTYSGGSYGTVFELAKGSSTITTLASFNGTNGAGPHGTLSIDSSGNLYGTASEGGVNGYGTIFEVAKGSGTITALASPNGSNGANPYGALIMDSSGNFYGATVAGGVRFGGVGADTGAGTVFELLANTPALSWSLPSPITYGTALSSTQLDASATDSVTGAAVAGTFTYTPPAGTILPAGNQTLSVTFTPTNTTEYNPISASVTLVVDQATPVLTWNTPAPITSGTALSSTQLDATAADPDTGSPVSGTFVYRPPAGTIVGRGTSTLSVTFTPTDTIDYTTTAYASVTLAVGPSSGLSTLALFNGANGANPVGGLIMDSSGNCYGTTEEGGANGDGTVFELAAGSGNLITLASFSGSNGAFPEAGVVMDSSGNLYGTTEGGGADGDGTVFELAAGSGTLITLASFSGSNGANPVCRLILDSDGNLYGTAYNGGANGDGTVFELANGGSTINVLASFNGADGAYPEGGLILDSGGNLYGTAYKGGADGDGTIFELAAGSGTITPLASFNGSDGSEPGAGLIMDSSGNLYGTTDSGGALSVGNVFELADGSSTINPLASFNGSDGLYPGGLIIDSSGNLYGTTVYGGANGVGNVFELANGSGTLSTLASFNGSNGAYPDGAPVMDSSGNLYGTTREGGTGDGTVFELLAHTPALTWSTPAAITYGTALSSAQLDASAADSGTGAAVAGTFVYTPAAGTVLHGGWQTLTVTFTPTDTTDYSPITTRVPILVEQLTPVLTWNTPAAITYGTPLSSTQLDATAADPNSGSPLTGTFAYIAPAGTIVGRGTSTLTVTFTPTDTADYTTAKASVTLVVTPSNSVYDLASFNGSNADYPDAGLIMDSSGNFYGTTVEGSNGYGTVFELANGSRSVTTLASFNGTNGKAPEAGLVMDSSGNLYGTTEYGGASGDGTVFELAEGSSTITTLASFNVTNGADPQAGLIMDSSGNLYGTTSGGSNIDAYGRGTVFELAKGSSTITTLASFTGSDGLYPLAGLIMDSSGNLYGTTAYGGAGYDLSKNEVGDGTVFELAKGSSGTFTFTTRASFNGANGEAPRAALIMDSSGNLYGTTEDGGIGFVANVPAKPGDGTVFELAEGSSTITPLVLFNGANGEAPWAGLIMDSERQSLWHHLRRRHQRLWHRFRGGAGSGLITTMMSFGGSNGEYPKGGLIMDSSGNLYGTTYEGGAYKYGTVFELPTAPQPSFQISGFPSSTSAGTPQTFTVTVQLNGTTDTGYTGTVHFTTTDGQAILPADYTFTANAGVAIFTATLKTAGTQAITATDTANFIVTGRATTTVTPAAATSLLIGGFPSATTAGSAANVTVTALDAYGNIATGYTGTVRFTSSDAKAGLPANFTFTSAEAGQYVFSATLKTAGTQSITSTDTVTAGMTSTQTGITVNPAAASVLVITGPATATAGTAFSITVTAYDADGNVATGYAGTVQFTSSDPTAKLPAKYTFKASDKGTHTFTGLVLKKKGEESITATDTLTSSITGSLSVDDS